VSDARWSLRARITSLCAATALLLTLIAAGAAAVALNNHRGLDEVFNKVGPLRTASDGLLTAMLNQETGVRGYAANGTDADLAPYNDGRKQEQQLTDQLNEGLGGRTQLLAKLRLAENAIADWHATVADPVIARVRSGDRAGAERLIGDTARATFDRVRTAVADLQSGIQQLQDTAVKQLTANSGQIVKLLIAAALVVLVAGLLLAILLRYLVTTPVSRLAGEVRRVAAGEYGHPVETDGPSEVAALARDVDGMRRKIVKDLAEVRTARAAVEEANQQLEAQAAALQAQASELTRSNRDLEQFAYVASHDLQEPLRKVASFCQLLQRRYAGQLDERADQYIGFAVDGAQRMQRLINDLLAFSRIGRVTTGFTDVDLNALVAETVSQHEATLERTGGEVTWDRLPVVRGEEALLAALIGNLISNSLKFRRPEVPPRIHLSARRIDDEECNSAWEISCQDNGIGIEPEFGDKVFVIFQRLHVKGAYPGTGIGLAIAKKIVEYHGGHIWLAPAPDHGADIRFTLPVERPAELPVSPAPAGASEVAPTVDASPTNASTSNASTSNASTSKEAIP
jgi:signal transduction histidine kinase